MDREASRIVGKKETAPGKAGGGSGYWDLQNRLVLGLDPAPGGLLDRDRRAEQRVGLELDARPGGVQRLRTGLPQEVLHVPAGARFVQEVRLLGIRQRAESAGARPAAGRSA